MKEYKVKIEGITPYMQHRMVDGELEQWEKKRGAIIERGDVAIADKERAEICMYKNSKGKPYLPAAHLRGALINAGGYVKAKVGNAKKSMSNIVAAMFSVSPDEIELPEDWIVDKQSAVNRNIKARIICIRPKWNKWTAEFNLLIDNDTITDATIKEILQYAGQYVGIGSFTPRHKGMYGRFKTTTFERIE